jgi:hypothetical protein
MTIFFRQTFILKAYNIYMYFLKYILRHAILKIRNVRVFTAIFFESLYVDLTHKKREIERKSVTSYIFHFN